jgi:tRNA G18 (ribose-2'-O)-methylase SpoU
MELQRPLNPDVGFSPSPPTALPEGEGNKLEALLDNVRSAWNVGAIFRTADALGVRRLYLCGITPTPENASVSKTALGADKSVAWSHDRNALAVAQKLKAGGCLLWGLEQDERAVSTTDLFADSRIGTDFPPIILIVGNEITGVDPALLDLCDRIIYIPMRGQKRSLNVEVAFGVAVSQILNLFQ